MRRRADARWLGSGLEGSGTLTTGSGALRQQPYSVRTRFVSEDGQAGTNPEELIAAAHAGCFNMALSFQLGGAGFPPEELSTEATLVLSREGVDWSIDSIHLHLRGRVPGITGEHFREIADVAKQSCPVSRALSVPVELTVELI